MTWAIIYVISGIVVGVTFEVCDRVDSGDKWWGLVAGILWPVTLLTFGGMFTALAIDKFFDRFAEHVKQIEGAKEEVDVEEVLERVNKMLAERAGKIDSDPSQPIRYDELYKVDER
jgi:hypothetical protein